MRFVPILIQFNTSQEKLKELAEAPEHRQAMPYDSFSIYGGQDYPEYFRLAPCDADSVVVASQHTRIRDIPGFWQVAFSIENAPMGARMGFRAFGDAQWTMMECDTAGGVLDGQVYGRAVFFDIPQIKGAELREGTYYPKYYQPDDDLSVATLGVTNVGDTEIGVFAGAAGDEPMASCTLRILPSAMDMDAFRQMIDDIVSIKTELLMSESGNQALPLYKSWDDALDKLLAIIKKLRIYIEAIAMSPQTAIKEVYTKKNPLEMRKFSARDILQVAFNGPAKKLGTVDRVTDYDIYENRIIKQEVLRLSEWISDTAKRAAEDRETGLQNIRRERNGLYSKFNITSRKDEGTFRSELLCSNRRELAIRLEHKNVTVKDCIDKKDFIQSRFQQLDLWEEQLKQNVRENAAELTAAIDKEMKKILKLKFIDKLKLGQIEQWHMTNIFVNDINYAAVYRIFSKIKDSFHFDMYHSGSYVVNRKLDRLYEYWIFIKLVRFFIINQKWQLEEPGCQESSEVKSMKDFSKRLDRYFKEKGKYELESMVLNFSHGLYNTDQRLRLRFYYNCSIPISKDYPNGEQRRPDFRLEFYVNENDRHNLILDAKYRHYYGKEGFLRDITKVAIQKYINELEDSGLQIDSSFIVHSDANSVPFYGGTFGGAFNNYTREDFSVFQGKMPAHKFGSVCFVPCQKTENQWTDTEKELYNVIKMFLEYKIANIAGADKALWRVCWSCGNTDMQNEITLHETAGGRTKFYMRCAKCNSFWVKNHCSNCKQMLIKRVLNYHTEKQKQEKWLVVCPVCGC